MNYPLPAEFEALEQQPVEKITQTKSGYYRSILLEKAGTCVPQHTHDYPHDTLVGSGRARGWVKTGGRWLWIGDKEAGDAFEIAEEKEHIFMALEPNTRLSCIHHLDGKPYQFLKEGKL